MFKSVARSRKVLRARCPAQTPAGVSEDVRADVLTDKIPGIVWPPARGVGCQIYQGEGRTQDVRTIECRRAGSIERRSVRFRRTTEGAVSRRKSRSKRNCSLRPGRR